MEKKLTLDQIKEKMIAYRDFYGGELLGVADIQKAKSKKALSKILTEHEGQMESMLSDALSQMNHFRKEIQMNDCY